jgi:hypothetical protein
MRWELNFNNLKQTGPQLGLSSAPACLGNLHCRNGNQELALGNHQLDTGAGSFLHSTIPLKAWLQPRRQEEPKRPQGVRRGNEDLSLADSASSWVAWPLRVQMQVRRRSRRQRIASKVALPH